MLRRHWYIPAGIGCLFIASALVPGGPETDPSKKPPTPGTFQVEQTDFVLGIVIDVSGSFREYVAGEQAAAFSFCLGALEEMWTKRVRNTKDRIVIATISGDHNGVIKWQGTPPEFRECFNDSYAFRQTILSRITDGSRVYDTLSDVIDAILDDRSVTPMTHVTMLACTDMENNIGTVDSLPRLEKSFARLAKRGGSVGLYWVDSPFQRQWDRFLRPLFGDERCVVSPKSQAKPRFPSF